MLSVHTCPLVLLRGKKTGGMNVYVRDFARELGCFGIQVDVFTRSQDDCQPRIKHELEPGGRVIHVPAGPEKPIAVAEMDQYLDEFTDGVLAFAEQYISSSLAAALLAAQPVTIALVFGLFGKWPHKMEWLGISVGIVGVVLLNLDGELLANPLGVAALLVSMLGWSFGTVLAREKLDLPGGAMTTSIELLAGGLFQLIVSFILQEQMKPLQPQAIAGWVYLAVVSMIGFTSYTIVIRTLRPTLASR